MSALGVLGVSPGGSGVSFLGLWVSVSAPVVDPLKVRPGALEKGSLWELPRLLSGAPWLVIDRPWGTARIDAMEAGCRAGPGAPRQGHQAGTVQVPWLGDPEGSEVDRPLMCGIRGASKGTYLPHMCLAIPEEWRGPTRTCLLALPVSPTTNL